MWLSYIFNKCIIILVLTNLTHLVNSKRGNDSISVHKNDIMYLYPNTENAIDLDVTTIYKIMNTPIKSNEKGGFKNDQFGLIYGGMYSIEIHSRTNAIGIPIDITHNDYTSENYQNFIDDNNNLFENDKNMIINFKDNWRTEYRTRNGEYCTPNYDMQGSQLTETEINECLNTLWFESNVLYYLNSHDKYHSLTMEWTPRTPRNYLEIDYLFTYRNYRIKITIQDENNSTIYTSILYPEAKLKTLTIYTINFNNKETYKIQFTLLCTENCRDFQGNGKFLIWRFSYYNLNRVDEDITIVNGNVIQNQPMPFYTSNYIKRTKNGKISFDCLNGGFAKRYNTNLCHCPPGFSGIKCEIGCGPNFYGADCSGVCSLNTEGCRGMYMCTMEYGCTCPPGLTGPWCDEDCPIHRYGADCDQLCSPNCFNRTCNQFTGVCSQGCSPGYVSPNCDQMYYYYDSPPEFVSAEVESITIQLNNVNELNEYYTNISYFQLLYKASNETDFTRSELMSYLNRTNVTITGLEPDTTYIIGVLLIMDDGYSSENDIVYGQYKTLCRMPLINDYNIKLTSGYESINVSWNKIYTSRYECRVTKYNISLILNNIRNKKTGSLDIITSSQENYTLIEDLWPGYEYSLTMTPLTSMGPLPTSPIYKAVPLITDDEISIKHVKAKTKKENGKIEISWAIVNNNERDTLISYPAKFILRYKIKKLLSCSLNDVERNWTSITLYNRMSYEILNVTPNAQYIIQVLLASKDPNYSYRENVVYVLTPASIPQVKPVLDHKHQPFITNSSVYVQWKIDPSSCVNLNGILLKFLIELKDTIDGNLQIKETSTPFITFTDLKPSTAYELKVFLKTNVGHNSERFLFFNFTTKFANLVPVNNLMVYKKSLKNRMVGFRWSYPENSNLEKFLISLNEDISTTSKNITEIAPKKCLAWPLYYCHTFYNVVPSNNYTIKVKAKSIDYPEGGEASTVTYDNIDGLPDTPKNFQASEIGSTNIVLQWDIPWIFNGVLKSFIINAEEISSADIETCCVSITPVEIAMEEEKPTYNYTLLGLKPGSTYSIGLMSKSLWYSSLSRIQLTTLSET